MDTRVITQTTGQPAGGARRSPPIPCSSRVTPSRHSAHWTAGWRA